MGHLVLQGGNWNGEQVIPADWIEFMATPVDVKPSYGGQVWLQSSRMRDFNLPADSVMFRSFLGQRSAVVPSRNLVMVKLGVHHSDDSGDAVFYAALEQVLNAVP